MNLISSKLEDIKMMSLAAFKKLAKKSKAEIIIITPENIKKQKKNNKKIEENLQKIIPPKFREYIYVFLKKILDTLSSH